MILQKIITFISLILLVNVAFAQQSKIPDPAEGITKEDVLKISDDDFVVGDKDAPVTIIEYASLTCSHCASFHNNTYADLKEKYIDTGKVRFVFRNFPLDEAALRAGMIASCAGNERFEKLLKVMFSTQSNWATKKNYLEILSNIAKLGGMRGEEIEACLADEDLKTTIMTGKYLAAIRAEVRSTPTFFVNNKLHKGARNLEYFSKAIDPLLGEKSSASEENKGGQ